MMRTDAHQRGQASPERVQAGRTRRTSDHLGAIRLKARRAQSRVGRSRDRAANEWAAGCRQNGWYRGKSVFSVPFPNGADFFFAPHKNP